MSSIMGRIRSGRWTLVICVFGLSVLIACVWLVGCEPLPVAGESVSGVIARLGQPGRDTRRDNLGNGTYVLYFDVCCLGFQSTYVVVCDGDVVVSAGCWSR